ncbi:hypothetical protein GBA52_015575 [Prunus armeniaca]|nr:hypothetical protein GBA52_015575 [Prunus armeniaca]
MAKSPLQTKPNKSASEGDAATFHPCGHANRPQHQTHWHESSNHTNLASYLPRQSAAHLLETHTL